MSKWQDFGFGVYFGLLWLIFLLSLPHWLTMCISHLFFRKQAVVFISLCNLSSLWMLTCTNCSWVKMTTHNEKNQHQRLQHLLLPCIDLNTCGIYFLLNFGKKFLLWPIFYRWCWWMNSKDKKFKMSRSAFRSWCWIRCVRVCTQLLLNCVCVLFTGLSCQRNPWCASAALRVPWVTAGRERHLVFLGWVGWAA